MGPVKDAAKLLREAVDNNRVREVADLARAWRYVTTRSQLRELTMVPPLALAHLIRFVDEVVDRRVPGEVVECGVWRGGASFLAAQRLVDRGDRDRTVWMFDSFEGLPPPTDIDGDRARAWANDPNGPTYFDNCSADRGAVEATAGRLGLAARTRIVAGWFDQTLPAAKAEIGDIALLRIDGDWYDSVRVCLDELYDLVVPGGIIVVDDYFTWDGCAVVVHEFLGARSLPHRIEKAGTAFFRKS